MTHPNWIDPNWSAVKKNAVLHFKILRKTLKTSTVKDIPLANRKALCKTEFVPIFVS